ncbi:MAG: hypothetical protein JKY02_06400 [Flavobacteriaceae bacterium]|nr:hypothetical protein [Flavobacteriaceae bacterium]
MSRPIYIIVINNTGGTITLADFWHNHGDQPIIAGGGNNVIPNLWRRTIYSNTGTLVGPQGGFNCYVGDPKTAPTESPNFQFKYNHPVGSGKTTVDCYPPQGYKVERIEDHLQHHEARCTYELKK